MTIENDLTEKHEVIAEDLKYAKLGDTPLLARLYRPRGVTGFASVIDVHGGAWVANDRTQNAAIDQAVAASGTAVLALDFRLAPASPYPASVADINLGIRWLKANIARFGGDPARMGGIGTSSGGHQLWLNVLRPNDPRYTAMKPPVPRTSMRASTSWSCAGRSPIPSPATRWRERPATSGWSRTMMHSS